MQRFEYDTTDAEIHGLSIQAGQLFKKVYHDPQSPSWVVDNALEAYKSLRRALPREGDWDDSRHIGATAAHKATQGVSWEWRGEVVQIW